MGGWHNLNYFSNTLAKLELKNGEKYFQTLEGHTKDALKILKTYIQRNHDVISQFCERWGLNKEKFLRNLFLTVYLHDIGKLTKEFQENIRRKISEVSTCLLRILFAS